MLSRVRTGSFLVAGVLIASLHTGCKPAPAQTPEEPAAEASALPPEKTPERAQINISPRLAELCGLSEEQTYFAYNSASVSKNSEVIFGQLARCFQSGPAAGRTLLLVGHADPRGEEEYNLVLAGRRAENVSTGIAAAGLSSSQMQTSSRGEMDASGTEEESWSKDRRVDLLLAD